MLILVLLQFAKTSFLFLFLAELVKNFVQPRADFPSDGIFPQQLRRHYIFNETVFKTVLLHTSTDNI